MNRGSCVLQDLADAIATDHTLKAVWLDAEKRRVSFACGPEADVELTCKRLQDIVARHRPDQLPDCAQDAWRVKCELCDRGTSQPMPRGIRMLTVPGAGVMLEKDACPSSSKFWRWRAFPWVRLAPRVPRGPGARADLEGWKRGLIAAGACAVAAAAGALVEHLAPASWAPLSIALHSLAYIAGAWFPATEAWGLLRKRILDVHFLMLCVALGAACIGHWSEGAILLFLFSLSGALEELALARTEREINALFRNAPREATLLGPEGEERRVPVDSLGPGSRIRVRPGEQFPADATLDAGETETDESNLTGESLPVAKGPGDTVFGGTLNLWGSVECSTLRPAGESALAKILRLIREAQESKAPSQRFTDRFGTGYTYAILGLCTAMFLVWWLAMGIHPFIGVPQHPSAFYRAMTLLVVASPCALVLSIPSAILAGIAAGARRGVLFRGGAAIERLAEIDRVALDKTGTLTTGELALVSVETSAPGREREAERLAASLGHHSRHPVSRAIARAWGERGDGELLTVSGFRAIEGMGVEAAIAAPGGQTRVALGRRAQFQGNPWIDALPDPGPGVTETILVAGDLSARLLLRDRVRDESAPLLQRLRAWGIRVTMLTGDRAPSALRVARLIGLDDVRAELSPAQKVEAIRQWTAAGERVAMVGDGVNDAPGLAAAHVAIGMGLRGSDAALEQADVVLMQDRIGNLLRAISLSRAATRVIRQNLAISLGVLCLLAASALTGDLPLSLGVLGHEGSTVLVVLNSLRLLFWKPGTLTPSRA